MISEDVDQVFANDNDRPSNDSEELRCMTSSLFTSKNDDDIKSGGKFPDTQLASEWQRGEREREREEIYPIKN